MTKRHHAHSTLVSCWPNCPAWDKFVFDRIAEIIPPGSPILNERGHAELTLQEWADLRHWLSMVGC